MVNSEVGRPYIIHTYEKYIHWPKQPRSTIFPLLSISNSNWLVRKKKNTQTLMSTKNHTNEEKSSLHFTFNVRYCKKQLQQENQLLYYLCFIFKLKTTPSTCV